MEDCWKGVSSNAFVSHAITYVQDYASTMKDLLINTVDEIKVLPEHINNFGLPSQDLTVLFTAWCSLLGLLVTFTMIFILVKCLTWIGFGSESASHEHNKKKEFVQESPVQAKTSAAWFKQASYDLMAARNDFEGHQPAPEWVCNKCLQALEKGLKAFLLASRLKETVLLTDDVYELAVMTGDPILRDKVRAVQGIIGLAHQMRYPDTFEPPSTPRDRYSLSDALNVYGITQSAIDLIRHQMRLHIQMEF